MRASKLAAAIPAMALLLSAPAAQARDAAAAGGGGLAGVTLDGAVAHPGPVDPASVARLATLSLPVVQATGHGVAQSRASGVLLWDLLQQAGSTDVAAKHAALRHTLLVVGRDGYQVAFSFGELDPAGGADPVLVVVSAGTVGLVVPGDRTAARAVHDVVRMTVR